MKEILWGNAPFFLSLVTGSYLLGILIYRKSKFALLHPVIVSMIVIILFLHFFHIPYESFLAGSQLINFMLGPAVVALGVLLYDQLTYIKGNIISMLTAISIGSVVGVTSVILIGKLMGLDASLIHSLEPKSVTTPIAMGLSLSLGGNPSLTAVTVVLCGIIGAIAGPLVHKLLHIKSPIAKGLSMGAAAHGLGTAKAMEIGALEGAISGLSIGLMGIMTSIAIPVVHWLLG
ncbi:MAG: LrgB family protein [Bacteroidales bacterium]